MKKIVLTLGFAAASILVVNAQDTPETLDQPIDETQEEVVEMQGEDSEAAMNQEPSEDVATVQTEGEGIKSISQDELPSEVTKGFKNCQFNKGTIEEAFVLDNEAVDKLIEENADDIYVENQNPDKIYQLQVKGDEDTNVLYFDEQGELLGSKNI